METQRQHAFKATGASTLRIHRRNVKTALELPEDISPWTSNEFHPPKTAKVKDKSQKLKKKSQSK